MHAMPGVWGHSGWQWMFIIEAVPSLILGVLVIVYMKDRIRDAYWLSEEEKTLLESNIAPEDSQKEHLSLSAMFANGRVWLGALIYFCFVMGLYGVSFWLPTIIKTTGVTDPLNIGLLTAIPYAFAAVAMVLIGRSADARRERRWHVAIPALIGCIGLLASTVYDHNTVLAMASLTVACIGILTTLPLFWSLPTAFLSGTAAAAGIALINSLGNLAGFVSPYLVGWLKDATQSTNTGMYVLAASLVIGALLTLTLPARLVNR
jgi:nitrate/nitrite transporter NarK